MGTVPVSTCEGGLSCSAFSDPGSCFIDPFLGDDVLHVTCWIYEVDGVPSASCPRSVADRCQEYIRKERLGDAVSL